MGRTVLDRSFGDVAVDGGRSLAAFTHLLPGVFKVARGKHFAAEVRQVEGFAANRLIDAVQLAQGERGAEQSGGHVGVFDFGAQAEQRVVDDLAMVERQLGQFVFGEPSYVVTVLEARGLGLADERPVHDGHHGQSAMGSGRASKGVQLFEVSRVQVCGRFEGRVGRLFQRPVGAQVTAGQRPAAQERLTDALDQGQPETGMGRVRGIAGIGGTVAGIAFRAECQNHH